MFTRSVVSTLLANAAILALSLGNAVLLARFLGPDGRGQIAAALLWPTMLIYLGSMGVLPAGVYFAAGLNVRLGDVLGTSALLCLGLALLNVIAGFIALPFLLAGQSPAVVDASRLYLLVLPISLLGLCGINILIGVMRTVEMNLLRMIVPAGYLIGTLVLGMSRRLDLHSIIWLQILLSMVVLAATCGVLLRHGPLREMHFDRALAGRMTRYGIKVHLGTVGGIANQNMSQALLASLAAPHQLGLFVTAVSAAGIVQCLSNAVQTLIVPRLRRESQPDAQRHMLSRIVRTYGVVSLGVAVVYGLVFPSLLVVVFGDAFRGAIVPGELLILAFLLNGMRDILIGGAQAMGRPLVGSGVQWLGAAATAVALALLMPAWGITGAAAAMLISAAVQVSAIMVGLRRSFQPYPVEMFKWLRFAMPR